MDGEKQSPYAPSPPVSQNPYYPPPPPPASSGVDNPNYYPPQYSEIDTTGHYGGGATGTCSDTTYQIRLALSIS